MWDKNCLHWFFFIYHQRMEAWNGKLFVGDSCIYHSFATCPPAGERKGLSDNVWSRHQCLFEENIGKTKMEKVKGLRILKMRVWELFTHKEGISIPRAHHKGRHPLTECANHDFKIMYFPFLWSTRVFPSLLRILGCDEEIIPM